jgi:hypothetical protein
MKPPRLVNRMPQLMTWFERRATKGVLQAVVEIGAQSSERTPVDTSTLINSRYNRVGKDGTRIVGTIGYTAEYALAVHDPDNPQTFRRATATKEFLKLGAEDAEPRVRELLAASVRLPRRKF